MSENYLRLQRLYVECQANNWTETADAIRDELMAEARKIFN